MRHKTKVDSIEPTSPIKKKFKETNLSNLDDFPVVAIGASAGGLEALEQFFTNVPEKSNMAYVVIQHLDPNHVGIMPELLQRFTKMKVFQASDNLKIRPNCVYVIPPNKSMSVLNGALHLFEPVESRGLRLPIDIFFRSLAENKQENSIGIILSGMGSDGSLGLKAIKEKNGIVLVQDPISAKFDGMPRSAIENVIVDIVAPAEVLPQKLISFLKFLPKIKSETELANKNNSNLEKIIILLRDSTGHDFSLYKKNTLFRRIERRKGIHQIDKIKNYVRFLQENPVEIGILFKELLIGVTSFFRDQAVWDNLRDKILPDLFNSLPNKYLLRAWVAGCSTGEEAYSLAIVFKESLEKHKINKNLTLQIFATDLDIDAVEKARKGIFSKNIASDISTERLNRFFTPETDGYRINNSIREMVVFATQNITKEPPFTKLDILSCRNMLIYFESVLQKKLISLFNYSLNSGGILLLGTAETIGSPSDGFKELDVKLKIYKRTIAHPNNDLVDFPSFFHHRALTADPQIKIKQIENMQSIVEQLICNRFAPASVLINEKGDIIYITGRTGKYLEPTSGKANWNIHVMAREGLQQVLPGAIRKAVRSSEEIKLQNIKIVNNGSTFFVDIIIQKLDAPEPVKGLLIVIFSDLPEKISEFVQKNEPKASGKSHKQIEYELELQRSREELQSTREEMQTSQEELKSTNEELQSTNEELQSTNEELTTSKEEMQSLNEELQTVNLELKSKINDLIRVNNDMKNLLNSTQIATLFVDKELNIRRYTDQVTKIFKIRDGDIGRPLTDIVSVLIYPEIQEHIQQVLKTLVSVETAIETNDNRWFNIRIMPYRTSDDRIDGLVITFTDISETKKLEIEMKNSLIKNRASNIKNDDA